MSLLIDAKVVRGPCVVEAIGEGDAVRLGLDYALDDLAVDRRQRCHLAHQRLHHLLQKMVQKENKETQQQKIAI